MEVLRQHLLFRGDGFLVGAVGLVMPEGQKVARGSLVNNSAGELLPSHSEPVLTINGASSLSGSVHIVELKRHPGGAYVRLVVYVQQHRVQGGVPFDAMLMFDSGEKLPAAGPR